MRLTPIPPPSTPSADPYTAEAVTTTVTLCLDIGSRDSHHTSPASPSARATILGVGPEDADTGDHGQQTTLRWEADRDEDACFR
jgi:hypothetical protein